MIARINLQERMALLGNKLVKILLCGESLCRKRYFVEILMRTPLGIPLISYVGEFDELRWE